MRLRCVLVGAGRISMAMVVLREAREVPRNRRTDDRLWTEGGLRRGVPLSCRRTCPDLAPCRFVGRLSWLHRAGPSATLDKSSSVVCGCYERRPRPVNAVATPFTRRPRATDA